MVVTHLSLRDFRNYERAELELGERLNVIHGPNGAGKTNLLEGLYFALTARSCRTSTEREMVRIGSPVTHVSARVSAEDGPHAFEVGFAPGEEKRLRLDGSPPDRSLPPPRPLVCVFIPDRLELVKGPPASRRAHLDQLLAALWPARAQTRAEYSRALAQRNALIARVRSGHARPDSLGAWDSELARHGSQLIADRRRAVDALEQAFQLRAEELGLPEPATLRYQPRSRTTDAEGLRAELLERRSADLERGFTTHGPHRDDLLLLHGDRPLRTLGSQGQQRVGLLALLFAERDVLSARGRPPLMLLDDVMSELDGARRERLAELVRAGGQAVITTTDVDHVPGASAPDVELTAVLGGALTPGERALAA